MLAAVGEKELVEPTNVGEDLMAISKATLTLPSGNADIGGSAHDQGVSKERALLPGAVAAAVLTRLNKFMLGLCAIDNPAMLASIYLGSTAALDGERGP